MDRGPYARQRSLSSSGSSSSPPAMSPEHRRYAPASGIPVARRNQNLAARAANARLARVMPSQANADAEEEEDDDDGELLPSSAGDGGGLRFGLPRPAACSNSGGVSLLGTTARSPSPAFTRNIVENAPVNFSSSAGRSSLSIRTAPMVTQVKTTLRTAAPIPAIDPPLDRHREKRCQSSDQTRTRRTP